MTRAQTMDVVNDSTTVQSRIDTVLAGGDDYDWSPDIEWYPGDPLYDAPTGASQFFPDTHEVPWFPRTMRCLTCETWWADAEACWLCGDPDTARAARGWGAMADTVVIDEAWTHPPAELGPLIAQMNEFFRQMTAAMHAASYHYTIDRAGSLIDWADPEPATSASREGYSERIRTLLLPAVAGVEAPTLAELASPTTVDVTSHIRFPTGAEITPVREVPLPDLRPSLTGRSRQSEHFRFNRPVTERRRR